MNLRWKRLVFPFLAFILPLGLYLKTLSPTYIPIDSAEFALCIKYWGMCHPPGFPLYVAVGHFFSIIFPFGSLIYKINLLSAIFGAAGVFFVYLTLRKLKTGIYLSILLSFLLAVSSVYWEFSLAADVFTFGVFLVALSFYLAFSKRTLGAFFVLGLAGSHFYITAIFWPLFGWYFWRELESGVRGADGAKVSKGPKVLTTFLRLVLWGVVFTMGFFPQAVMYIRMQQNPAVNWGHAQGLSGFWYYLRRQEFGSIFLLSNPALTFSLFKLVKNVRLYFVTILINFGVIVPLVALFGSFFRLKREVKLLLFSFAGFLFVQLTLLSTIDPTGENNPFQLNKFYLTSFVLVILLAGPVFDFLSNKFFGKGAGYFEIFLGFLIVVYLLANFRIHNYSSNRFSEDMVLDALSQLPENSIAITVSHIIYFGGRYEQEVNSRFPSVDLLYFPNEKNRDNEFYKPGLFNRPIDGEFFNKVKKNRNMGKAEEYVLSVISGNLDRDIYILQGTFEEGFFQYLKPYIVPYGLWWRVSADLKRKQGLFGAGGPFGGLKNGDIVASKLNLKQQRLDALTYAVSFHSTGIYFASIGDYDKALSYLDRTLSVGGETNNISAEKELILTTRKLASDREKWTLEKNETKLMELGNNLFTLGNYRACEDVFNILTEINMQAVALANLASCQASAGKDGAARDNYNRALSIDPDLEVAKRGLSAL